jgi:hypothetical protein
VFCHFDEMIESGSEDLVLSLLNIIKEGQELGRLTAGAVQHPSKDARSALYGHVSPARHYKIVVYRLEPSLYRQPFIKRRHGSFVLRNFGLLCF